MASRERLFAGIKPPTETQTAGTENKAQRVIAEVKTFKTGESAIRGNKNGKEFFRANCYTKGIGFYTLFVHNKNDGKFEKIMSYFIDGAKVDISAIFGESEYNGKTYKQATMVACHAYTKNETDQPADPKPAQDFTGDVPF